MRTRHLVALGLLSLMVLWMFIPRTPGPTEDRYADPGRDRTIHAYSVESDETPGPGTFAVRVAEIEQQDYVATVRVRGRTQAFRHVNVRAETAGRVVATPFPRGARVEEGDVLCEIAVENREIDLQEAVSREQQARMEYEGELELQTRGLQGRVAIAQRKAALDAASAAVERARLSLERTRVRAPFTGIMESRNVEVGDYLDMGAQCASLIDDQPMLLVGQVAEHEVGRLSLGAEVEARLVTGERVYGELTFLARSADPATRSYRIEVELEPADTPIRQGVTAELLVSAQQIRAHLVPPSSLTLDDDGAVGVKILDDNNEVHFRVITIVGESTRIDEPGFWVTGLPARTSLITLGQEMVFPGQTVRRNSARVSGS